MILAMFLICCILGAFFFGLGLLLFKVLYTFCIGLPLAVCLGTIGMVFCITVIGIPLGMLMFRLAGFVLLPFR